MASRGMVTLSVPPALLARGFWIYVWKIGLPDGTVVHYVGMTGDTGSFTAGSPFKRAANHLDFHERSNPLRKYLEKKGCPPERCHTLDLMAFGPIGEVPTEQELYKAERGKIAALERALCVALRAASYDVLHDDPGCRFEYDQVRWHELRSAFSESFPFLRG